MEKTLRDEIAMHVIGHIYSAEAQRLDGLLERDKIKGWSPLEHMELAAADAYDLADAMIEARKA